MTRRTRLTFTDLLEDSITHLSRLRLRKELEPMARKKTAKRRPSTQRKKKKKTGKRRTASAAWSIPISISDNVLLTLDIRGFMRDLDLRVQVLDQEKLKVNPKTGGHSYSLTECGLVCGVEAPQLNYYVKQGIIKADAKYGRGEKKYFAYDALLTFWIIVKLKELMRINVDVIKDLQSRLKDAGK